MEYLPIKVEVISDTEEPDPESDDSHQAEVRAPRPKVILRDLSQCTFQDSSRCANCYERIPWSQAGAEFLDRLWGQPKKAKRRTKRRRVEKEVHGSLTVAQALELVFDVKRKSHLGKVILDETNYALCSACTGLLKELCLSYARLAKVSRSPSYVHSLVVHKKVLWKQVELGPEADTGGRVDTYWAEGAEASELEYKPQTWPSEPKRKRGRPKKVEKQNPDVKNKKTVLQSDEEMYSEEGNANDSNSEDSKSEPESISRGKSSRRPARGKMQLRRENGTRKNRRVHQCPECPAVLVRTDHLRRHMKVHSESNVRCEHCQAGFRLKTYLNQHLSRVHDVPLQAKEAKLKEEHGMVSELQNDEEMSWEAGSDCAGPNDENASEIDTEAAAGNSDSGSVNRKKTSQQRHVRGPRKKGRGHKCPECPAILARTDHLRRHVKVHSEHNVRCEQCQAGFRLETYLAQHMARVHDVPLPPKESYACTQPNCSSVLNNRRQLKWHLIEEHGIQPDKQYSGKGAGSDGAESESGSASYPPKERRQTLPASKKRKREYEYKCPECPAVYRRSNGLRCHSKVHAEHNLTCHHCMAGFKFQAYLDQHLAHVHSSPVPPKRVRRKKPGLTMPTSKTYPCTQAGCTSVLMKLSHFNRHIREKHGLEPEPLVPSPCPVCPVTLRSASLLAKHLDLKHRPSVWLAKYECPECGKKFRDKNNYQAHLPNHLPDKPFMCHVCAFTTKRSYQLTNHVNLMHGSQERPFPCSTCGLAFKFRHHLRDHEQSHLPAHHRPFLCPIPDCGKAYRNPRNLRAHIVHHRQEKFPCDICERVFTRADNLKVHRNTVHFGKPGRAARSSATAQRRRKKKEPNLGLAEEGAEDGMGIEYLPESSNMRLNYSVQAQLGGYYYG